MEKLINGIIAGASKEFYRIMAQGDKIITSPALPPKTAKSNSNVEPPASVGSVLANSGSGSRN